MQPIGDSSCYVTQVRPESDAATKGMKPGDQVVSINGISVVRETLTTLSIHTGCFLNLDFTSPCVRRMELTARWWQWLR